MSFAFAASESSADRATQVALQKLSASQQAELADNIGKGKLGAVAFEKTLDWALSGGW